jgi:hypothetical protein
LAEEAAVFAIELCRAFVADLEGDLHEEAQTWQP